jgi:N-succinyldiaminopimelate aminotransferase
VPDPLVSRLRPYVSTIFGEMSALANATGSVNLGQGFPDTDGPAELINIASRAMSSGLGNQYPPAHGLPELRRAIAAHQERYYGLTFDPETDVVVATGASEALAASLFALVGPGDEVVMFEPYFDIYAPQIAMAGATKVTVPLGPGFRPDTAALRAAVTPRTKLLLINSPHNPTGAVYTGAELDAIGAIAVEHDRVIVSDEAYEHLWYDNAEHVPIASRPGLADRTVTIGSGGKSFSFTGWKVGWATGPAQLIRAVRVARQHLSYVSSGPFQYAIAAGLGFPDSYFQGLRQTMSEKRDLWCVGLDRIGIDVNWPQGTYFATSDIRSLGYSDGVAFCRDLPTRAGVVAIPLQPFLHHAGHETLVRWAFCKRREVLDDALERMRRAFN